MSKLGILSELLKKTFRFGPFISLGNVALTYGRNFLPPHTIKQIAQARNKAIQRRLTPLVNRVLTDYSPSTSTRLCEETIWVCWMQGEKNMPPIPTMCLKSIRNNASGRKVQVITLKNFSEFVTIDNNILNLYHTGKIKNCHFADILRVSLLAQRGGIWMDATLYCTAPLGNLFFQKKFHSIRIRPYGNFVSQCRWSVYCLSSLPGCRLFSILEALFVKYLSEEHLFIDYFLFDQFIDMLYQRDEEIRNMIDGIPESNPNIFGLADILTERFDSERWEMLTANTSIFKLNWKAFSSQSLETSSDNSYYKHLKSILQ